MCWEGQKIQIGRLKIEGYRGGLKKQNPIQKIQIGSLNIKGLEDGLTDSRSRREVSLQKVGGGGLFLQGKQLRQKLTTTHNSNVYIFIFFLSWF